MRETFGADTPVGAVPPPRLLGYYAVFFTFGAFFYQRGIPVRRWRAVFVPPALGIHLIGPAFVYPEAFAMPNAA